jgi:DNA-binding response OmpR family regulator
MSALPKILLVEDHLELRNHVAEILQLKNYTVITAEDGAEGLKLASESQPDLVLCDTAMPRMGGNEMLQALRATERGLSLPFVFLTGKSDRSAMRARRDLGADDYPCRLFSKNIGRSRATPPS